MKYVAFDLGASSGKLFEGVLGKRGLELTPVYSFPNGIITLKDGMYWDFMGIFREVSEGLRRAERNGRVDAFGIDSFNNDFSLIDAAGELLMPVRSYRDPRTLRHWDEIFARVSQRDMYLYSGNQIAPFNTLMHLAAMNLNGQHFLLEHSHLRNRKWIDALFETYDVPRRLMPPLRMPGTVLGASTDAFNAQCRVAGFRFVNVCEHDTASAFVASPLGGRAALISSGTWALVGADVPAPVIDDFTYRANIANEGGPDGHHRLLRNVMGMWLIQELKRNYALDGQDFSYPEIARLALSADPFRYPIDPDDPAFYLPGDMREKIRAVSLRDNGVAPTTPAELFRCVYEALAMKYRWVIGLLERAVGREFPAINIFGGGCQDALLNRFTAAACGREVLAGPVDASAIGNIAMQMIALGELKSVEEARELVARSFPMNAFAPEDTALWNAHYDRYLERFEKQKTE